MPSLLLLDYLQRCRAQYSLANVPSTYSADECIRLNRIPPRRFAKVVMVRLDAELAMVVMPANYRLVPKKLAAELKVSRVELAAERQFRNRFPRCELGAIPPIGHLFGLRAFCVSGFDEFSDIFCKAGSHTELLRMPFRELQRFAHWDPIGPVAELQLRQLGVSHLQRLLKLAKTGGTRTHLPLALPLIS